MIHSMVSFASFHFISFIAVVFAWAFLLLAIAMRFAARPQCVARVVLSLLTPFDGLRASAHASVRRRAAAAVGGWTAQ